MAGLPGRLPAAPVGRRDRVSTELWGLRRGQTQSPGEPQDGALSELQAGGRQPAGPRQREACLAHPGIWDHSGGPAQGVAPRERGWASAEGLRSPLLGSSSPAPSPGVPTCDGKDPERSLGETASTAAVSSGGWGTGQGTMGRRTGQRGGGQAAGSRADPAASGSSEGATWRSLAGLELVWSSDSSVSSWAGTRLACKGGNMSLLADPGMEAASPLCPLKAQVLEA